MSDENNLNLPDAPNIVMFPLEMSLHLKEQLQEVKEKNFHLIRHLDYLENELKELRKFKMDNNVKIVPVVPPDLMASKLIEISKKNRDMHAEIESLKTKIIKLVAENGRIKMESEKLSCSSETTGERQEVEKRPPKTSDELVSSMQQMTQMTNKMMEYRREAQQLKIELRNATKALCQEVGDGVTPQIVLSTVTQSTWRGRQLQIHSLRQQVSVLQQKLNQNRQQSSDPIEASLSQTFCVAEEDIDAENVEILNEIDDTESERSEVPLQQSGKEIAFDLEFRSNLNRSNSVVSASSNASHRTLMSLQQQEMKKFEQIENLKQDLEKTKQTLLNAKIELKANKARTTTMDNQLKTLRQHGAELEYNLREKTTFSELTWSELTAIKQELIAVKDRERRIRDQSSVELHDTQNILSRERRMLIRLQQVLDEKTTLIQQMEEENIELRRKLEVVTSTGSGGPIGEAVINRISLMETQLADTARAIEGTEKERVGLMKIIEDLTKDLEKERSDHIKTTLHLTKTFAALEVADKSILDILEVTQTYDEKVLTKVECSRALIRELKLGDMHNLNHSDLADSRKVSLRFSIMKKEVIALKQDLRKMCDSRKRDLNHFYDISQSVRENFMFNLQKTVNEMPWTDTLD